MTCGIYIIYYECEDAQYYIGKSVCIEERYKQHYSKLKLGKHENSSMQEGFNNYGAPSIHILEILPNISKELFKREVYWISVYNSFRCGMNSTVGGDGTGYGDDSPNTKYPNSIILEIFNILVDTPEIRLVDISKKTGVSKDTIGDISSGRGHRWLEELYPSRYSIMLSLIGTRGKNSLSAKSQGILYPKILAPDGIIHQVSCIATFADSNFLSKSCLGMVLKGIRKAHKGWTLA